RLGIDHFSRHGIVGRGVLLDVARYLETTNEPMRTHERREIPASLLRDVARAQGVEIKLGDIVMFRTGTAATIHDEAAHPERAVRPSPGGPGLLIDDDMMAWLWDNQVAAIVSDNLAVEAWPNNG